MSLRIITADQRLAEVHAPKILIAGPAGIGKTSLLRTLPDPTRALFIDIEAGDLAVQDVPCDTLRPTTWPDMRNLACFLGGPDVSLPPGTPYSQEHYEAMVAEYGGKDGIDLAKYDLLFVDSLTVALRLALRWAQQQPEAFSDKTGKPDPRGAYGLLGREALQWLTRLQHTRGKAVVFVAILENVKDEFGRASWELQMDGAKAGRELPGIVDQVIAMGMVPHPAGADKPEDAPALVRAFLCTPEADDFVGFMPKDRSGRLDAYELPHLGDLLAKLTAPKAQTAPADASARAKKAAAR